jgi:hypothetical protein
MAKSKTPARKSPAAKPGDGGTGKSPAAPGTKMAAKDVLLRLLAEADRPLPRKEVVDLGVGAGIFDGTRHQRANLGHQCNALIREGRAAKDAKGRIRVTPAGKESI